MLRNLKKLGIFLNNPKVVLFNSCTSALTAAYQIAGIKKFKSYLNTTYMCSCKYTSITFGGKNSMV